MSKVQLVMQKQGDDETGYISADGTVVLRREKKFVGWVLRVNGKQVDNQRYRNDIASQHGFELTIRNPDEV